MVEKNQLENERSERNISTKIFSLEGEPIMECVIKQITGVGARIEVAYFPELVPEEFRLEIDKVRPKCRIRWSSGNELGVEFVR
jgi:hypothetical protein